MAFKLPPPPAINKFDSASWQDWFFKLRTALIEAFSSITLQGIPAGGDAGDVLTKVDTVDYNATWSPVTISIPGGTADQLLTKIDATLNNYEWRTWTFHGIPAAGTTGQALVKTSNTDYAVNWATILGIPAGGSTNQVLGKTSGTDYAVSWQTVSIPDPPPTGNIIHNSNFQHRDKSTSSVTFATAAPYSRHASRWYGIAPSSGFTTVTVTTDDIEKITVKRAAGTYTSTAVKLVQILDTEDSIKLRNVNKSIGIYWSKKLYANLDEIIFRVSSGTGVNQSLANFLSSSWTGQASVDDFNAYSYSGIPLQWSSFSFGSTITQIAFSIEVAFSSFNSTDEDEVYIHFFLVNDPGDYEIHDDKSMGLISSECDRYYQVLKQYLTTTPIAVPIHMRKIPTITISPSVAFTTTGTTKDSLVINVNSSGDAGLYTVTLDCEF